MASSLLSNKQVDLEEVPIERLEAEIADFASHLAASTGRWLLWVAAYDRRKGWESWEVRSCSAWLSWKCGMSRRTASQHVAVAHKIAEFKLMQKAFLNGELSFSKARAISRIVTPANEAEMVELAKHVTATQLDRICSKIRRYGSDDEYEPESRTANVDFRNNFDGTASLIITGSIEEIAAARANIEARASQIIEDSAEPETTRQETIESLGGLGVISSSAALGLICETLDEASAEPNEVLLVADLDALSGSTEGESHIDNQSVAIETARRLACDANVQMLATDEHGTPLSIGRRSRTVPKPLRRVINRRDNNMCQFPGCSSTRRLHAHHVEHWANGGETSLENLVLLCHFHHHSVHERGWNVRTSTNGWIFSDPDNVVQFPRPKSVQLNRFSKNQVRLGDAEERAARLGGSGEQCDTNYVADVIIENSTQRYKPA